MRNIILIIGFLIINQVIGYSCTIFSITKDGKTLVGNNEDYIKPNTKVWITPTSNTDYGCIFFTFDAFWPLGGMNSEGLFFDWALTTVQNYKKSNDKKDVRGSVCKLMLQNCANVKEAIDFIENYNIHELKNAHMLIADKLGNSAVIEWNGNDISVIKNEQDYQVLTNFNIYDAKESRLKSGRYCKASEQLEKCDTLTVDFVKEVLKCVHQNGKYPTLYSNVYDLQNQLVYVYYRHNYEYVHVFDIKKELDNEIKSDLAIFFPQVILSEFSEIDFKKRYNNKELKILGLELQKIEEYNKAAITFEYDLELYPDSDESLKHLIDIYAILNNDKKTKKYTKRLEKRN
ncbi:MAG: carcinine hydrolase/isopenicillin-N N-acyltransferase family protein [Bacteroidales bacterium]|jgi:predicted choloylglycine hydrolase